MSDISALAPLQARHIRRSMCDLGRGSRNGRGVWEVGGRGRGSEGDVCTYKA